MSLDPHCLSEVVEDIRRVGQAAGAEYSAEKLASEIQGRINRVASRTIDVETRPRVLHLEWVYPLMCAGHWMPEMVEIAGGVNCFGSREEPSYRLEWDEVVASRPDVIILMPCGFDVERALQDLPLLTERDGWSSLPAVQSDRVYALDAGAYTSRSGPRLAAGLEILAEIIHPELFSGMVPPLGAAKVELK